MGEWLHDAWFAFWNAIGPAVPVMLGAAAGAVGGYFARQQEDVRSRRAELLTIHVAEARRLSLLLLSHDDDPNRIPSGYRDLRNAVATLERHAAASSRLDRSRTTDMETVLKPPHPDDPHGQTWTGFWDDLVRVHGWLGNYDTWLRERLKRPF